MPLLAEYAITPDVFDNTSYSNPEVCNLHLQSLKEVLLTEGIVRNLHDGAWSSIFNNTTREWHSKGKELMKKLATQGRLCCKPSMLASEPGSDQEWCQEALESHAVFPLSGIVSTKGVAERFPGQGLVAPIDRLTNTPWWTKRSSSVRIARATKAYKDNLSLVLECSNSIMFIDPYLDPTLPQYLEFIQLLVAMGGRTPAPLVEIHRKCYMGSGPSRKLPTETEWKTKFKSSWGDSLESIGLATEIFIWDDFHDRHVISNLVGIQVPNGFDISRDSGDITTWVRIERETRDDIQREFDSASTRHKLRYRFRIP